MKKAMKWLWIPAVLIVWLATLYYTYGLGGIVGKFAPEMIRGPMEAAAPIALLMTGDYEPCMGEDLDTCGYKDATDRVETDCGVFATEDPRTAVLFTFGQSNSANSVRDRYIPLGVVANFNPHDGKCYLAEDPLLGPDGSGGTVWGIVGDLLLREQDYERVLIVPVGIGGTEVARWSRDGDLHGRLRNTAEKLGFLNIRPTFVLWHQGESDVVLNTSTEDYVEWFGSMVAGIREYGIDAPIFPAVASVCAATEQLRTSAEAGEQRVRTAQRSLPSRLDNVWPGPDTDAILGQQHRHDGCHFTHKGARAHAQLWVDAIANYKNSTL